MELPNEKGFGHLRFRLAADKNAIFDRLNRLVRCFVDCRAFDGDALSIKAGLELARALAANSWDNKPSQLSQIPGCGAVTVRKLVSHGIHTVLSLADRGFDEIERVMSRNPPYGMNMLKTLENFPRLAMKAQLITKSANQSQAQDSVTVTLEVNLNYRNAKSAPTWNGKVPATTFMASTADGNLAYFWRGNLRSIVKSIGVDLKFPVILSGPDQKIFCYFSCEEIVGTQVTETLTPNVPATAFTDIPRLAKSLRRMPAVSSFDEEGEDNYGDIPDEDMLSAMICPNENEETELVDYLGPVDETEDEFTLIDDLLPREGTPLAHAPVRMDNGKWMCNHPCHNGGLTRAGKQCTHRCCHEGLDKPRRPLSEKKKSNVTEVGQNDPAPRPLARPPQVSQANTIIGTQPDKNKRKQLASRDRTAQPGSHGSVTRQLSDMRGSTVNLPNAKRKRSKEDIKLSKRRHLDAENSSDFDMLSDIECIDLTMATCEQDKEKVEPSDKGWVKLGASNRDSHYYSDLSDDDDEFPDLETLIGLNSLKVDTSQTVPDEDKTLYAGVVQTLKESLDYG